MRKGTRPKRSSSANRALESVNVLAAIDDATASVETASRSTRWIGPGGGASCRSAFRKPREDEGHEAEDEEHPVECRRHADEAPVAGEDLGGDREAQEHRRRGQRLADGWSPRRRAPGGPPVGDDRLRGHA